ncbi:Phage prohead protease and phage major capsid protein [Candidatus Phycorickettsia trachydisci]|uniref:Phage prohead protease and phage major capsid protein n=1 Tax=Candidatus Phycorickettsia trachydisci TaxID=2115978 RepID=A0A2P1P796_9RICK|nr:phage major capsid protein [Candidatus Phycorickettsia trachydisci]AVP87143.1 Phage prohead protease and phage major capsid protein [Candidatus Phycorickettsia trachydisci]
MSNQIQEHIAKQISSISNEWDNFRSEYKELKNQVSSMNIALNRPHVTSDNAGSYAEKSAFADYLRKGEVKFECSKQFSSDENEGGGLIMPHFSQEIVSQLSLTSPLRKLASVITTSSNKVDFVFEDGKFESGWVAETAERDKVGTPKLQHKQIEVHEVYAQPTATQRLIDDSSIDIYNWMLERLADQFGRNEGYAFINGDGDKKPQGILKEDKVEKIALLKEKEIHVEDILNMINRLDEYYLGNASFIMNRATLSYIQTLKDETGRFIWQPSYNDTSPQTLFGIPVYCSADMPIMSKDAKNKVIALGDFRKGYKIVDRASVNVMRDPYTSKPFVKFYATKRVGGAVIDPRAINVLEF